MGLEELIRHSRIQAMVKSSKMTKPQSAMAFDENDLRRDKNIHHERPSMTNNRRKMRKDYENMLMNSGNLSSSSSPPPPSSSMGSSNSKIGYNTFKSSDDYNVPWEKMKSTACSQGRSSMNILIEKNDQPRSRSAPRTMKYNDGRQLALNDVEMK